MECVKCKRLIPDDGVYCPYCGKKQAAEKKKRKKRANGMGTVWKKSGNRSHPWEAQKAGIYIGAYATRYEAEQALQAFADTKVYETINLTFAQIYEKWLPEHSRTITKKGMEGYATAYKHCASLYDRTFRKLRTSDFQQVIINVEEKGLSRATCTKILQLFGQLSEWAIREEICHTNYARFVTITAKSGESRTPFTPDQIAAIQRSPNPAAQIAVILMATGCRPNELFSVPLSACEETYFISGSKTEAGRNRVIPVAPFGLQAYQSLRTATIASGGRRLIDGYPGRNRSYPNYVKRDWKDLMSELGIANMTPYNCRHTFTTLAVQSGLKPEILQKILGHADYSTTANVYTHLDKADILSEASKLTVTDTLQTRKSDIP